MPHFSYTAIDARGSEKTGLLDAPNADHAIASLRAKGLFPTNVSQGPVGRATPAPATTTTAAATPAPTKKPARAFRLPFMSPVSAKELSTFTRQLATLLHAGMPLMRGLEVLAKQEKNRAFQEVIAALSENIRSGGTLSEAMTQHPKVFDRLFINMIKAGEAGGVLDVVLERLARFQEKSLRLKGKIASAMMYPVIVMGVAVLILAGLLVFVVPKFKQIFADLLKGAPLPPLTQFVLTVSDAVKNHFLVTFAVIIALSFAFKAFKKTVGGKRLLDTLIIKLPPFGDLFLKALIARFSRTLGTLLSSGVPILQALIITRDTSGNARVAEAIDFVHDRVKEGDPVARPLESAKVFPPMVTSMIDVGEHTGQLPEMLTKIADIYDEEVDNTVAGLSSLIEPILIVFLAVVVGTIVIALFLPIIRIVQLMT